MNSKGQLIITDLMLYIIILVFVVGMVIYALNILNDNNVVTLSNHELNHILQDTLDILVKTEGSPSNWDNISTNNIKTVGLRKNSSTSSISYNKLIKLKNNDYLVDKFIPEGLDYSLNMYSKDNPQNQLHIAGEYSLSNKKNIYSKQVPIIIDYGYDIYAICNDNLTYYCPYNHNNLSNNWICKPFLINKTSLNNGKYYILTNKNNEYTLSNTYNHQITGEVSIKKEINSQLDSLLESDNDTIYIHINTQNTAYLVYDSNNLEEYLDSIYNPEVYILNLSISN